MGNVQNCKQALYVHFEIKVVHGLGFLGGAPAAKTVSFILEAPMASP